MEKISLKLFEFYNLDAEINGLNNPQTGEKVLDGLLQAKLPLTTKYWLSDLSKKVKAEKQAVEDLKTEMIRKYGKEDANGGISIPILVEQLDKDGKPVMVAGEDGTEVSQKVVNPDYQAFEKEFNELLQTEKELEYKPFSLENFESLETTENYNTFFKLIKVEDGKVVSLKS
jgi:uncharacterized protein (UPF0216 family)